MLSNFPCAVCHLYVLFEEISIQIFCLFFFFFLTALLERLNISTVNPSSVTSFANIFSHSVRFLFFLFMVSFALQKLLSIIRSSLFISIFIFFTLGGESKKISVCFMSKSVLFFLLILGVTGTFGLGVQNEARQRLIEFCQENALIIANTLFQQNKRRCYTWTSPDGQY